MQSSTAKRNSGGSGLSNLSITGESEPDSGETSSDYKYFATRPR